MKGTPLKRGTSQLKRTPLKRGKSQMKKTVIKKTAKKHTLGWWKKKFWVTFSLYIRTRDKFTCFTCGRIGEGKGMHAGHFISKSVGGLALYFHENNVHCQCYNCNINLSGNQWEYGQRLGKKIVDELFELKHKALTKFTIEDYQSMIEKYKIKLEEL